jgi:hypothetical protein
MEQGQFLCSFFWHDWDYSHIYVTMNRCSNLAFQTLPKFLLVFILASLSSKYLELSAFVIRRANVEDLQE